MKIITTVFVILCFIVALIIGAENKLVVNDFNYIIATANVSLTLLLGITFILGALFSGIMLYFSNLSQQITIVSLKHKLMKLKQKLQSNSFQWINHKRLIDNKPSCSFIIFFNMNEE